MRILDLDILDYRSAWKKQEEIHAEVHAGGEEAILIVEHPPTITFGRRRDEAAAHLVASPPQLRNLHVELVESDRGGDITFHGPGQIVAYPIVRLADHELSVGAYMRCLQEGVVATLADFHVGGRLDCKAPGVWVDDPEHPDFPAKICAVGVRVKRGITMHGLALNVEPDLSYFDLIVPCGLSRPVTSLHKLLGARAPSIIAVKAVLTRELRSSLNAR